MPLVKISMRKGASAVQKAQINETIHRALVMAFQIPEHDFNHRIDEYEEENFHIPPGKSEHYMILEISVFPGRSLAAKRKLYLQVMDGLGVMGYASQDVLILLQEQSLENWGIQGKPASEIDLGFKLDV